MARPDLRRVAEIHIAAWHAAYTGVLPAERLTELNLDEQHDLWDTTLFDRRSRTNIVYENEFGIGGWLAIGPARDDDEDPEHSGEIYGVHVHPDHHRQGIGTSLLAHAHQHFRNHHFHESLLWVVEGNQSARHFYQNRRYLQDSQARKVTDWLKVPEVRYRRKL